MTVRELLSRADSRELAEWMAYYELDPFGNERADLRAGIIASATVNCHSSKPVKASDFMPKFDEPPKEQTVEQRLAFVKGLAERHGDHLHDGGKTDPLQ